MLNATCFFSGYFVFTQHGVNFPSFWSQYILIVNLLWLFLTSQTKFYFTELTFILLIRKTVGIIFLYLLLLVGCYFIIREKHNTNELLIVQIFLHGLLILSSRYIFIRVKEKIRPINYDKRRTLIIGESSLSPELLDRFSRPDSGYALLGQFRYNQFQNGSENASLQDKLDNIINYAIDQKVSEIFLMHLPQENIDWKCLIKRAEEQFIRIKFVPDYDSVFAQKINLRMEQGLPIITLRKEPLENIENRIIKRAFDIVFSLLVILFLLSWLIPILAILIKLESRGPVFFKQGRPGLDEQEFFCYKFRSMQVNGHTEKEASKNDPRVTRTGKFMRKTSVDELPQFFNVLLGDMSVVGPRPHLWSQNKAYASKIKKYMVRHYVKPGITGLA
ncbi:MAG: exopolysaccharide biosynthesis polyprenyl glycosylphosphotransferase, partial [Bacteroidota bacterium]